MMSARCVFMMELLSEWVAGSGVVGGVANTLVGNHIRNTISVSSCFHTTNTPFTSSSSSSLNIPADVGLWENSLRVPSDV